MTGVKEPVTFTTRPSNSLWMLIVALHLAVDFELRHVDHQWGYWGSKIWEHTFPGGQQT